MKNRLDYLIDNWVDSGYGIDLFSFSGKHLASIYPTYLWNIASALSTQPYNTSYTIEETKLAILDQLIKIGYVYDTKLNNLK